MVRLSFTRSHRRGPACCTGYLRKIELGWQTKARPPSRKLGLRQIELLRQ